MYCILYSCVFFPVSDYYRGIACNNRCDPGISRKEMNQNYMLRKLISMWAEDPPLNWRCWTSLVIAVSGTQVTVLFVSVICFPRLFNARKKQLNNKKEISKRTTTESILESLIFNSARNFLNLTQLAHHMQSYYS